MVFPPLLMLLFYSTSPPVYDRSSPSSSSPSLPSPHLLSSPSSTPIPPPTPLFNPLLFHASLHRTLSVTS